jgi:hypothetical protein
MSDSEEWRNGFAAIHPPSTVSSNYAADDGLLDFEDDDPNNPIPDRKFQARYVFMGVVLRNEYPPMF